MFVHTWGEGVAHINPIILPLVPCPFWRYPKTGYPHLGMGYPLLPGQDGGYPKMGYPHPGMGYPQLGQQSTTRQAVCLLRSGRRTFLFILICPPYFFHSSIRLKVWFENN